jgi:hypothetical protein
VTGAESRQSEPISTTYLGPLISTLIDNTKLLTLSPEDQDRLERLAPLFNIDFVWTPEGSYRIGSRVEEGGFVVTLSTAVAHRRLLAEICARASINDRFGRGTVSLGSAGATRLRRQWDMKQGLRTPRYTTDWEEIPVAKA